MPNKSPIIPTRRTSDRDFRGANFRVYLTDGAQEFICFAEIYEDLIEQLAWTENFDLDFTHAWIYQRKMIRAGKKVRKGWECIEEAYGNEGWLESIMTRENTYASDYL